MAITPLPSAPQPTDTTAQFNTKAFAWVAALSTFTTEANALATQANTDASTATTQAGIATTQAGIATTQAGIATTKAGEASTSETNALAYKNAAEAARDATLAAYDNFDDRYLGSKTSDPTVDNDGNPLVGGALYFNSVDGVMKIYTGSIWVAAYVSGTGFFAIANNLSELTNPAAALSNLGLTATAAELNYMDGVTSNVQTQLNNKASTGKAIAMAIIFGG